MESAHVEFTNAYGLRNDIQNLVDQTSLRWIFVGGKGGVGKTTISCSIASILAEHRESVLLLSTDPAHSLSDAFGQKFTHEPRIVNGFKNLYAMELDTSQFAESSYDMENEGSMVNELPEIIQMLPGLDEAVNFAELMQSVQSSRFSVIIFDTAPTGHTLKFLKLPEVLDRLIDSFLKFESILGSVIQIFDKIKRLKEMLKSTKEQMKDPNLTTFVCVCIPEFLSVYETERLVQDLAKFDIDCSYIIVNQVIQHVELGKLQMDAWQQLDSETRSKLKDFFEAVKSHQHVHNGRVSIQRRYLEDIRELYQGDFNLGNWNL
ncbi:bifunctional Arsenical pump ATPase [Babesia duncani]|uniref:Bifunctional Arsenical pump ATPase n=1 Tax=Babesia duncani TaxID=323732 RepID=A0AAD9PMA6_9APIC|nr:bifunctional Arsenical pump ATPase [Babesia duncani]